MLREKLETNFILETQVADSSENLQENISTINSVIWKNIGHAALFSSLSLLSSEQNFHEGTPFFLGWFMFHLYFLFLNLKQHDEHKEKLSLALKTLNEADLAVISKYNV